jgi:tetratricopeptide (TPR) repeat protein
VDKAIDLAPDVSHYYIDRANIYLAYLFNEGLPPERGCSSQGEIPYRPCLAVRSFQSNLEGVAQRPFYFRQRLALASSTYNLPQLAKETVRLYRESLSLVPDSWPIRNELANAYIQAGRPTEALHILSESLNITKETPNSERAYFLQGSIYKDLGELAKSATSMERSLLLGLSGDSARQAHEVLAEHNLNLGLFERALNNLDQIISVDPNDAQAHEFRGIAYSELGRHELAIEEFEAAIELEPGRKVDPRRLGKSNFHLGRFPEAIPALDRAINVDSEDVESLAYRGKAHSELGQSQLAFDDLNMAIRINPLRPESWYLRGLVNLSQDSLGEAARDLDEAIRIDPGDPRYHIARGHILNASGQLHLAKE